MSSITQGLKIVNQQIHDACASAHRNLNCVRLLAVSKTKPLSAIEQAYLSGQREFGENYLQEGLDKIIQSQAQAWLNEPIVWHFIGPLQSNKTKAVAEHFDWLQSLDRLKIAQRLNAQRPSQLAPLNVLIQVNISDEESKSGIALSEVLDFAQEITKLERLSLRGLMAIPQKQQGAELDAAFAQLKQCFEQLQMRYSHIDTLSMGMSDDMASAIAHGSTMVRVGTAIFGQRN